MMYNNQSLNPRAQKAQEEAAGRWRARQKFFDAGPYLSEDRAEIVIPSPAPHPQLAATLKSMGFTFEPGYYPQWVRPTARPTRRNGKTFTPEAWLKSAKAHYAKAWGWGKKKGQNDERVRT